MVVEEQQRNACQNEEPQTLKEAKCVCASWQSGPTVKEKVVRNGHTAFECESVR